MVYPNNDEGIIGSFASFGNEKQKKKKIFNSYRRRTDDDSVSVSSGMSRVEEIFSIYIPAQLSMIHYWCGLFFTSLMSLFFALDAVFHCNETYTDKDGNGNGRKLEEELEYYDMNENEIDKQAACMQILKATILLPSIIGMIISAVVVTVLIRLNGSSELKAALKNAKVKYAGPATATATALSLSPSPSVEIANDPTDSKEEREQRRQAPLFGFLAFLCSIAWGREIFVTMLLNPWRCQQDECSGGGNSDDDEMKSYAFRTSREDEMDSLGAVNSMGEVGANANLFYFSWISFILSVSLCYGFTFSPFVHNKNAHDITSDKKLTIYSFRVRMGSWISTAICCVVILTVSTKIWREIVAIREYRIGQITYDDATVLEDDLWNIILGDDDNPFYSKFLPIMFERTKIAILMGLGGTVLSLSAIMAHWFVGQGQGFATFSIALWIELVLSLLQFLLFGIAGWFVTGSGGPAQSVGVLYYATMATFLISLRILIGCVEEVIEAHKPVNISHDEGENHNINNNMDQNLANISGSYVPMDSPSIISAQNTVLSRTTMEVKNHRPGDLRKWALIATFSSLNLGSVLDGINNMEIEPVNDDVNDDEEFINPVDRALQWMIFAPSMAIIISTFFFFLTLRPQTYYFVVKHKITLLGSMLTFGFWCSNLLITMHAESSFAVNGRGEIITANQYYFSWASCSTSFMNFLAYQRRGNPESLLAVLWSAILKISLVMISAAVHVWGNIRDDCQDESIHEDSNHLSFCRRTQFALYAGYIGLVLSSLLLLLRICVLKYFTLIESIASIAMMGLFTIGTYLITGIDGPGQVVGDLYYATWGVLFISLVIGESCWEQFSEQYL